MSTLIPSAGLGYRLPLPGRRAVVEVTAAHVGQDSDPDNRAPAITFFGVFLRSDFRPSAAEGAQPFLTIGIGQLRIDAPEEVVCDDPVSCPWEGDGGPTFTDGSFTTAVAGGGVVLPLTRWAAIRGDVRVWVPIGGTSTAQDSDNARFELAGGFALRW